MELVYGFQVLLELFFCRSRSHIRRRSPRLRGRYQGICYDGLGSFTNEYRELCEVLCILLCMRSSLNSSLYSLVLPTQVTNVIQINVLGLDVNTEKITVKWQNYFLTIIQPYIRTKVAPALTKLNRSNSIVLMLCLR